MHGKGMTLTDQVGQQWRLSETLDAAHFKGEDLIDACLHDGPILDFNLMTRRKDCRAKVFTSQQEKSQKNYRSQKSFYKFRNPQVGSDLKARGNIQSFHRN